MGDVIDMFNKKDKEEKTDEVIEELKEDIEEIKESFKEHNDRYIANQKRMAEDRKKANINVTRKFKLKDK